MSSLSPSSVFAVAVIQLVFVASPFVPITNGELEFLESSYTGSLYQNAPPRTSILRVKATDDESTETVSYYVGLMEDIFQIGEHSGVLMNKVRLDEPVNHTFTLPVMATCRGEVKIAYSVIRVVTFNKYQPKLDKKVYNFEVYRNAVKGSMISRVKAKDPDKGNALKYTINDNSDNVKDIVELNAVNGELVLKGALAKLKILKFDVVVTDDGSPVRKDNAKVTVVVRDIPSTAMPAAIDITKTSAKICWHPLQNYSIDKYVLSYWRIDWEDYVYNATIVAPDDANNNERACYDLTSLLPWKKYGVVVTAFAKTERSPRSDRLVFKTKIDGCMYHPCEYGKCISIDEKPGYRCNCDADYYGPMCQYYNACRATPCLNKGICTSDDLGGYTCQCPYGYFGKNCTLYNPCINRPCRNNASCYNTTLNSYFCSCHPGYYGQQCQHLNPCHLSPCRNGATCYNISSSKYGCTCTFGYYGTECQTLHPCTLHPCTNNGTCIQENGANFKCVCPIGYEGVNCERYNYCLSQPCQNGGKCFHIDCSIDEPCPQGGTTCRKQCKGSVKYVYGCKCPPGRSGPTCTNKTGCKEEITTDESGDIYWPKTRHSTVRKMHCPFGSLASKHGGMAFRRCTLTPDGVAVWGHQSTIECMQKDVFVAGKEMAEIRDLTLNPGHLSSATIEAIINSISKIVDLAKKDNEITKKVLMIMNNIMAANTSVLIDSKRKSNGPARLLDIVERCLQLTDLDIVRQAAFSYPNIRAQVLVTNTKLSKNYIKYQPATRARSPVDLTPSEIKLPREVLAPGGSYTRVVFAQLANSKLFITGGPQTPADMERYEKQEVMLATAKGAGSLKVPAEFTIKNYQVPGNYTCVYWDPVGGHWSTRGVVTDARGTNTTKCLAYHLSAFSLMLDQSQGPDVGQLTMGPMTSLLFVGCGISAFGLAFTLLTYILFGCLRAEKSGKILINQCCAMLLLNASFIVAITSPELFPGSITCTVASAMLHYCLLCVLTWLCVEAFHAHRTLASAIKYNADRFLLKRFLLAWGLPVAIVGTTVAVDMSSYEVDQLTKTCLVIAKRSWVYYFTVLVPYCLVMTIMSVASVMSIRFLAKPKRHSSSYAGDTVTITHVLGALTVAMLVGLSWVFGMFVFGSETPLFQYIFCATNSLQGLCMFLVRCILDDRARAAWILLLKDGAIMKKQHQRHKSSSAAAGGTKTNDISSSEAEAARTLRDEQIARLRLPSPPSRKNIYTTILVSSPTKNVSFWPNHKPGHSQQNHTSSADKTKNRGGSFSKRVHPPSLQRITFDDSLRHVSPPTQNNSTVSSTTTTNRATCTYKQKLMISGNSTAGAFV